MAAYKVEIAPSAAKVIANLDKPIRRRVMEKVDALAENPRPAGCIQMRGQLSWRIRVGKVRIIYEIHDAVLLVAVIDAGYRREIYD
jgi:mRNA interferase RelE/StbE